MNIIVFTDAQKINGYLFLSGLLLKIILFLEKTLLLDINKSNCAFKTIIKINFNKDIQNKSGITFILVSDVRNVSTFLAVASSVTDKVTVASVASSVILNCSF